jgi:uncharacterized membrane protein
LLALYALALVVIALTDGSPSIRVPVRPRILALMIVTATVLAISLTMYAVWTPVGANAVEGIQGRYFHPIAPLALFVVTSSRLARRGKITTWFPVLFIVFNAIGLAITSFVIVARYYR